MCPEYLIQYYSTDIYFISIIVANLLHIILSLIREVVEYIFLILRELCNFKYEQYWAIASDIKERIVVTVDVYESSTVQ